MVLVNMVTWAVECIFFCTGSHFENGSANKLLYRSIQFSGRKLTWLHNLSNGDIKLNYTNKTYIINMTTIQVIQEKVFFGAGKANFSIWTKEILRPIAIQLILFKLTSLLFVDVCSSFVREVGQSVLLGASGYNQTFRWPVSQVFTADTIYYWPKLKTPFPNILLSIHKP